MYRLPLLPSVCLKVICVSFVTSLKTMELPGHA
jgi:hypothetical protein